jgi:hypothetical protein
MPNYESLSIYSRPGDSTGVGTLVATLDGTGLNIISPANIMQDSGVVHANPVVNVSLVAATASSFIHTVREGRWRLAGITLYFQTGSTSGAIQVTVDTGTNAPGTGTVQLTGVISLAVAVQQTALNGTLIASPTVAGPGDRFSILISGVMASLANGMANISLERVA